MGSLQPHRISSWLPSESVCHCSTLSTWLLSTGLCLSDKRPASVKRNSPSQWNGGYGADSSRFRGDLYRPASRPFEAVAIDRHRPWLPFEIGPMNGLEARESGLRLNASVASPGASVRGSTPARRVVTICPFRTPSACVTLLSGMYAVYVLEDTWRLRATFSTRDAADFLVARLVSRAVRAHPGLHRPGARTGLQLARRLTRGLGGLCQESSS